MKSLASGFTLLEVMVAVAIIGILAAIAIPSYTDYILRANRAEGREWLMRVSAAQERFYTNRNTYTDDVVSGAGLSLGTISSEKGHYNVRVVVTNDGQSYELIGLPQGRQTTDKCGELSITNVGVKGYSGNEGNGNCW